MANRLSFAFALVSAFLRKEPLVADSSHRAHFLRCKRQLKKRMHQCQCHPYAQRHIRKRKRPCEQPRGCGEISGGSCEMSKCCPVAFTPSGNLPCESLRGRSPWPQSAQCAPCRRPSGSPRASRAYRSATRRRATRRRRTLGRRRHGAACAGSRRGTTAGLPRRSRCLCRRTLRSVHTASVCAPTPSWPRSRAQLPFLPCASLPRRSRAA